MHKGMMVFPGSGLWFICLHKLTQTTRWSYCSNGIHQYSVSKLQLNQWKWEFLGIPYLLDNQFTMINWSLPLQWCYLCGFVPTVMKPHIFLLHRKLKPCAYLCGHWLVYYSPYWVEWMIFVYTLTVLYLVNSLATHIWLCISVVLFYL